MRQRCIFCLLLAVAATAGATAAAAETSASGNTYLAGGDLRIATPVAADLIAAGGRLSVEREVGADAALAGGSVELRAPVGQDARVAAGTVSVDSRVGADLVASGGTVRIGRTAEIAGSAWLAGGDVSVAGRIGNGAKVYGSTIALSGQIAGDTRLYGRRIVVAPGARIDGNLSYASPEALPDGLRAQVSGTITRLETPEGLRAERAGGAMSWFHPLFVISMLICGMLLYLLFPGAVAGAEGAIAQYPVRSLLTGLALLFAVPPVALLFMGTVVGLPLGFALLLLYPLALLLGYLAAAFFVGRQIAAALRQRGPRTLKKQAFHLALALLLLSVALAVPFLGGFILIVAVVAGIGGLAVWGQSQYRRRGPATG